MKGWFSGVAVALLCVISPVAQEIPPGTLLPIQLGTTLKAGKAKPSDRVSAKLRQDVVFDGRRLARGSQVSGRVIESQAAAAGMPGRLVLVLDTVRIRGRDISIASSLRALASMRAVFDAQLPTNLIDDYGSTIHDWNTVQVGGQGVYRGDGKVISGV